MIPVRIVEIIDSWLELKPGQKVFTSLEGENPGGSIKDRMVHGELEELTSLGKLKHGGSISEVSAGSTATSMAHYCPQYGVKCLLFVPNFVSEEIADSLRKSGAELHLAEMSSIYEEYEAFLQNRPEVLRLDQLFDIKKQRHYHKFGEEIVRQLGPMDFVLGGVGTGHSLLGTAAGMGPSTIIMSAEPQKDFQISGVRNVEHTRYGANDTCQHSDFNQRQVLSKDLIFPKPRLESNIGYLHIPQSFQLAMGALKQHLSTQGSCQVFVIGASIKRLSLVTNQQVA